MKKLTIFILLVAIFVLVSCSSGIINFTYDKDIVYPEMRKFDFPIGLHLNEEYKNYISEAERYAGGKMEYVSIGSPLTNTTVHFAHTLFSNVTDVQDTTSPNSTILGILSPVVDVQRTLAFSAFNKITTTIYINWRLFDTNGNLFNSYLASGEGKTSKGFVFNKKGKTKEQFRLAMDEVFKNSYELLSNSYYLNEFSVCQFLYNKDEPAQIQRVRLTLTELKDTPKDKNSKLILLCFASRNNKIKVAEKLVSAVEDINGRENFSGLNPMHFAAKEGNIEIIDYLISQGANPNIKSLDLKTPLYFAAFSDQTETWKFLLDKGAELDASDENHLHRTAEVYHKFAEYLKDQSNSDRISDGYKLSGEYYNKASIFYGNISDDLKNERYSNEAKNILGFVAAGLYAYSSAKMMAEEIAKVSPSGKGTGYGVGYYDIRDTKSLKELEEIYRNLSQECSEKAEECDNLSNEYKNKM